MPKISVVMSTYSRVRCIGRAIDSILAQTFKDFELIIIDDGSTDGTKDVIERYAILDDRIRWVRFNQNSALPAKRYNQGMSLASAEYITFMFDDDVIFPNALADLYQAVQDNPTCDMIYGLVNYMDARNNRCFGPKFGADWNWQQLHDHGNYLCNISVIVKRSAINAVGGYDEAAVLRRLCDWDLWVRVGEQNRVKKIQALLGEVWGFEGDSVGVKWPIEMEKIREHQQSRQKVALRGYWDHKKRIVFVTHGHDASLQRWRIDYLIEEINRRGGPWSAAKVDVANRSHVEVIRDADVVVMYRFYRSIKGLKDSGKLVLYDIDDYVFQENGEYNSPHDRGMMLASMSEADIVTISSPYLEGPLKPRPTFVRENAFPDAYYDYIDRIPRDDNGKFRIGFIAGINRNENNEFVLSVLRRLPFLGECELFYFGKNDHFSKSLAALPVQFDRRPYVSTNEFDSFYTQIAKKGLHCVINPLKVGEFFDCKSEIKFIECAIAKVPIITSGRGMFKNIVDHGKNGFLAETPEEFARCLEIIYKDRGLGADVGREANRFARRRYSAPHVVDRYLLFLDETLEGTGARNSERFATHKVSNEEVMTGQLEHTAVLGEVRSPVAQRMVSRHDGLCAIEILGGTYARINDLALRIVVRDLNKHRNLYFRDWDCKALADNSWWRMEFNPSLESAGHLLELHITPVGARPQHAVTFYYSAKPIVGFDNVEFKNRRLGPLVFRMFYKTNLLRKDAAVEHRKDVVVPPERKETAECVLIKRQGGLGDMICLTPGINKILSTRSATRVVVETNFPSVFDGMDRVSTLPYGQRSKMFDDIIDLSYSYEMEPKSHIVDKFNKMIAGGEEVEDKSCTIFTTDEDEKFVDAIIVAREIDPSRLVVCHCGVTWKNRTLPSEKWERLIKDLSARGKQVVVVGSGSDYRFGPGHGAIDLVGQLTIQQLKVLIGKAKLFIGPDSGVMHIAGTTSVPMVIIFTSTDPKYREPYRKDGVFIPVQTGIECQGCFHTSQPPVTYVHCARGDFLCLTMTSVGRIIEAAERAGL